MSYFVMLDTLNKLTPSGNDLKIDSWKQSNFFLPFRTSFEIDSFQGKAAERVKQTPIFPNSDYLLYLKFSQPTEYVIRINVVYRVARVAQFNENKNVFISHLPQQ